MIARLLASLVAAAIAAGCSVRVTPSLDVSTDHTFVGADATRTRDIVSATDATADVEPVEDAPAGPRCPTRWTMRGEPRATYSALYRHPTDALVEGDTLWLALSRSDQTGTASLNPEVWRITGINGAPSSARVEPNRVWSRTTVDLRHLPSGAVAAFGEDASNIVELASSRRVHLGDFPALSDGVVLTSEATWRLSAPTDTAPGTLEQYSVLDRGAMGPATRISSESLSFTGSALRHYDTRLLATDPRRGFWALIANRFSQRYALYSFDSARRQRGAPIEFSALSSWPFATPYVVDDRGLWITVSRGGGFSLLHLRYDGRVRTVAELSATWSLTTGSGCVAVWSATVSNAVGSMPRGPLVLFDQQTGEQAATIDEGGVPVFVGDTMYVSSNTGNAAMTEGRLRQFVAE